jgi:uncharacterized protein (DUF1800 family)
MKTVLPAITKKDWGPEKAAHLLNRAGFGATPETIQRAADSNPRDVVDRLVDYQAVEDSFDVPDWAKDGPPPRPDFRAMREAPEEERRKLQQQERRKQKGWMEELRAWWLYRMRYTQRPLQEKLTLFWHGHFATGVQKVKSAYAMYRQNQTFREHANGNWRELVTAVSQDPAMLVYLDNARSTRRAPNENYARELMELFTLGEGHYTEEDIKASARAFTGWSVDRQTRSFTERTFAHDDGMKRFFGEQGRFDGHDVIRLILEKPRAAEFITEKLWRFFAHENPAPLHVQALAERLRKTDYDLAPMLKTLFLSRAFYSDEARRTQIKSPVQWLVGTLILLDARMPRPRMSTAMLRTLGQELFEPPNVKGWDGGVAWITTANLLNRYNLAGALCKGPSPEMISRAGRRIRQAQGAPSRAGQEETGMMSRMMEQARASGRLQGIEFKPGNVLPSGKRKSAETAREYLQWRLYQSGLREQDRAAFLKLFEDFPPPSRWTDEDLRNLLHLMMSTPQYQLT